MLTAALAFAALLPPVLASLLQDRAEANEARREAAKAPALPMLALPPQLAIKTYPGACDGRRALRVGLWQHALSASPRDLYSRLRPSIPPPPCLA